MSEKATVNREMQKIVFNITLYHVTNFSVYLWMFCCSDKHSSKP